MRTKITMLLTVFTLLLSGMFALASPAAAAPAVPYNYSECFDYWGDGSEIFCWEEKGVAQYNETSSGNFKATFNGQSSFSVTVNGELVYTETSKAHYTFLVKDGEVQVSHPRGTYTSSYGGMTCTFSYNVVFANGELRHEMVNSECV